MKWSPKAFDRLYLALWGKLDDLEANFGMLSHKEILIHISSEWEKYLKKHGIRRENWDGTTGTIPRDNEPWDTPVPEFCFVRHGSVVLDDPWNGNGNALVISEEMATKILVLGAP